MQWLHFQYYFCIIQFQTHITSSHMQPEEYHDYVIIGAGISGLHAAQILSQHQKDFVILQATAVTGGRIGTQTLQEVIKKQSQNLQNAQKCPEWILKNPKILATPMEYGATWIAQNHNMVKRLAKQLKIEVFSQHRKGDSIYGIEPGKYTTLEHLYNEQTKQKIQKVLNKIEKLKNKFIQLYQQAIQKGYKDKYQQYKEFVSRYDLMSVQDFFTQNLNDKTLLGQIFNFIQCLQCISCKQFSMMQLIDDSDSLSIVYQSIGQHSEADDDYRVKTGMHSLIRGIVDAILRQVKNYRKESQLKDILKFNQKVTKIQSWKDKTKQARVIVESPTGIKIYSCKRILNSIPLATLHKVENTGISKGKRLIIDGQQMGDVYRNYIVMKQPFWRSQFNGYGGFSPEFPFNQMTDISPSNDSCGVLAFVCYAHKYDKWIKQVPNAVDRHNFIKRTISDMFLKGDIESKLVQQSYSYTRTFSNNQFIKAAYQPTTKMGVWKAVEDSGEEYGESFDRDENGVHYIGSQFDEEYGSYMQGALRITRKKVYQLLSKSDPWRK